MPFLLPVTRDVSTLQYLTQIRLGSSRPLTLVLDLNGRHIWTSLAQSTRRSVLFRSSHCLSANGRNMRGGNATGASELSEGAVAVDSPQRSSIPAVHQFLFAHAPSSLLSGLASGARGVLGLGRVRTALPEQLSAAASGGDRRFFLCLSESDGIIVSCGDWPYSSSFPWRGDVSRSMIYAPLSTAEPESSREYSLNLKAIEVNGERLTLSPNSSILLSTIVPYTTMQSDIYRTFTGAFGKAAVTMNMTRAPGHPAAPFELCFSSDSIATAGSSVPEIEFVLQSEMVRWRVHGQNSMVRGERRGDVSGSSGRRAGSEERRRFGRAST
ncbi:hypothetical protein SAY87_018341 [Trapa incisa]|uniref:Peptidase A1 domain-containing protein n=1 Tax=Trapa incisa TaxID=236973 RepID=A0AAN7L5V4_9MYRT|nr:hypothetical protein SAY87_018341 [Trapa incisa]